MILHSDGRIEGTPAEIAEYKERTTKAVKQFELSTMTEEELKKMLGETTVRTLPFITGQTKVTVSESEDMRQQREYGKSYVDTSWNKVLEKVEILAHKVRTL